MPVVEFYRYLLASQRRRHSSKPPRLNRLAERREGVEAPYAEVTLVFDDLPSRLPPDLPAFTKKEGPKRPLPRVLITRTVR